MTTERRSIRALVEGAELRTASYLGIEHVVCPVVMMVGDAVVRGVGSKGPELVPAGELAMAPASWNGRPVVPDHPEGGNGSANTPAILESWCFGQIFNARYEGGRLKAEAWINPRRAEEIGELGKDVVARLRAGEMVEVSVGCWVSPEARSGISADGKRFEYVWHDIVPDHLAMLPDGVAGACSVEMGCGAPRAAEEVGAEGDSTEARAAALSAARRPTYGETETSPWSAPRWADYVNALYEGDSPPASVGAASAALKRAVASRTLLGDPRAATFRDLTLFPVVNPRNDRLNERALRAVLGGRGSQAEIPESALESAREMAQRLLESEFGAEPREASAEGGPMPEPAPAPKESLFARMHRALISFGVLQEDEGPSDADLRGQLHRALHAMEPAFDCIVEVYHESQTVIYITWPEGQWLWWRRSYTLAEDGAVTLGDDREQVEPVTRYEVVTAAAGQEAPESAAVAAPLPTSPDLPAATCGCQESAGAGHAAPTESEGEANPMSKLKELAGRLIACERSPFTDADAVALEAFGEDRLAAMAESFAAASVPEAPAAPSPPVVAPTPAAATPEDDGTIRLSREEVQQLRSAAAAHAASEQARKDTLVACLKNSQDAYTDAELIAMPCEALTKLARALKLDQPAPDFSGVPFPGAGSEVKGAARNPPNSYQIALAKRRGEQAQEAN